MIALIAYERKVPHNQNWELFSPHPACIFPWWLKFYEKSKTSLPFRVFTDYRNSIPELKGHNGPRIKTTVITAKPPLPPEHSAYSDWLRSELYEYIQQPFIFMDLDAFILQNCDQILDLNAPLAMTSKSLNNNNEFNAGLILFKQNYKDLYQKAFNEHPKQHDPGFGQQVWSDMNKQHGTVMPIHYHYHSRFLQLQLELPDDPILIFHLVGKRFPFFVRNCNLLLPWETWPSTSVF